MSEWHATAVASFGNCRLVLIDPSTSAHRLPFLPEDSAAEGLSCPWMDERHTDPIEISTFCESKTCYREAKLILQ